MSLRPPSSVCSGASGNHGSDGSSRKHQQRHSTGERSGCGRRGVPSSRPIARRSSTGSAIHSSLTGVQGGEDGRPPLRATLIGGVYRSMTVGRVRYNSVRFDREESDWCDESSGNHSDGGGSTDMEVLDLRPRRRLTSGTDHSSSLVSFGSASSIDSQNNLDRSSLVKFHGQMFAAAASVSDHDVCNGHAKCGGSTSSSRGGEAPQRGGEEGTPAYQMRPERSAGPEPNEERDMPAHWVRPETRPGSAPDKERDTSPCTVRLQRRALPDPASRCLGDAGDMSESDSDAGGSTWTDASPPTGGRAEKRGRGAPYLRRCAQVLAGFMVLVVFGGSFVVYLFPPEDRQWIWEILVANSHFTLLDKSNVGHRMSPGESVGEVVDIPQQFPQDPD